MSHLRFLSGCGDVASLKVEDDPYLVRRLVGCFPGNLLDDNVESNGKISQSLIDWLDGFSGEAIFCFDSSYEMDFLKKLLPLKKFSFEVISCQGDKVVGLPPHHALNDALALRNKFLSHL